MKIPSKKEICEMSQKEINQFVTRVDKALVNKGWYEKNKKGSLTETEQETFDRLMDLMRWIRINAD